MQGKLSVEKGIRGGVPNIQIVEDRKPRVKKAFSIETVVFVGIFAVIFGFLGSTMGVAIIPGVLIICTVVMMLTGGPSADGTFTGAAYEGIGFLPWLADKVEFILSPLFGFSSSEGISVPITALGAAGAAIGLVPGLVNQGLASGNDIAVFTAMCMCWSGYLSTHVAMMDSLGFRELTGRAILCHTIGGLCAGVSAHLLYTLLC